MQGMFPIIISSLCASLECAFRMSKKKRKTTVKKVHLDIYMHYRKSDSIPL